MEYRNTSEYPVQLDHTDQLAKFRSEFFLPQINNSETIYFCGNSLGLQPKATPAYLEEELRKWQDLAVEGHFKSRNPWTTYQKQFKGPLAELTGALPNEVVAMNSLTINLHLMMVSFYRPSSKRFKIITEAGGIICPATPSFYSKPQTIEEVALTVVDRVLDLAGFDISSFRWGKD